MQGNCEYSGPPAEVDSRRALIEKQKVGTTEAIARTMSAMSSKKTGWLPRPGSYSQLALTEILAEEGNHLILEAIRHVAGVPA